MPDSYLSSTFSASDAFCHEFGADFWGRSGDHAGPHMENRALNAELEGSVFRPRRAAPVPTTVLTETPLGMYLRAAKRGPRVHRQCSIREVWPGQPPDEARRRADRPFVHDLADHDRRRPASNWIVILMLLNMLSTITSGTDAWTC